MLVDAVLAELRSLLGAKRFSLWIDGKIGLSICDDALAVGVGSPFLLGWMQKQFKDEITAAARVVLGHSARVTFVVDASLTIGKGATPSSSAQSPQIVSTHERARPMTVRSTEELQKQLVLASVPELERWTSSKSAGGTRPRTGRSGRPSRPRDFLEAADWPN